MLKKSRHAYKKGYRWGHQDRYDTDDEYRENCIMQQIPRVLWLHTPGKTDTDVDRHVWDVIRQEQAGLR